MRLLFNIRNVLGSSFGTLSNRSVLSNNGHELLRNRVVIWVYRSGNNKGWKYDSRDNRRRYQQEETPEQKSEKWKGRLAVVGGIATLAIGYSLINLDKNPYTGRWRVIDISEEQERKLGKTELNMMKQRNGVLQENDPRSLMVRSIAERIISQIEEKKNIPWTYSVIPSDEVNAMVFPGGDVVVFTGLLQTFQKPEELAVILGHETAHVLCRHHAEKMAFGRLMIAMNLILAALTGDASVPSDAITSVFGSLPVSRKLEMEADEVGLTLIAKAGFDPDFAPMVFERLSKIQRVKPPQFLSTHPSDEKRIVHLQALLPKAKLLYEDRVYNFSQDNEEIEKYYKQQTFDDSSVENESENDINQQ